MGSVPFVGSVDSLPPLTIFIFFRRFSYVKLLDMKRLIRIALVAAVAFSTMGIATAQNSKADKKEKIKEMIEGNRYFFTGMPANNLRARNWDTFCTAAA